MPYTDHRSNDMHPLYLYVAATQAADKRSAAAHHRAGSVAHAEAARPTAIPTVAGVHATDPIVLRRARPQDGPSLERLAALDSAGAPQGETLVAERGGRIVAALPLGGDAIADPFEPTADVVTLLQRRAALLHGGPASHGRLHALVPHRRRARAA